MTTHPRFSANFATKASAWLAAATLLISSHGALAATDVAAERASLDERFAAIAQPGEQSEQERYQALVDWSFDSTLLNSPLFATYIGNPKYQDIWADNSQLGTRRAEASTREFLSALKTLDRDALSDTDQLNLDMLIDQTEQNVRAQRFLGNTMPINQLGGPHQNLAQVISLMPARKVEDFENILSRLSGIDTVIENTITWMNRGLELGATPPKITLRDVPQQVKNQLVDEASDSPLLRAFAKMPDSIAEAEQTALKSRAEQIFNEEVRPAFERLHTYLTETYIPQAREDIAAESLPDGKAWYAHNVASFTTTSLTPAEIHEIGLREVNRIRAEMEAVREETEFDGDLAAFFEFLRTDPQFFHTSAEALLAGYRDIAKRADPELVKLFGNIPRLPYGVVAVPAYAEKSQTTAYYQPGSLESGRPGNFFANTYALDTRPKWEMEALTLHEGVPGHHFQIALQQELDDLPWFRRYGWGYTGFVEGWGLYSESLGEEMGFYTDPYSRFGALTYEMWRAIRLVVDTGMHHKGWTREQAIQFFANNAGKSEHDITVEVDRYIVWPGQALAYKIGQLKMSELRARATETLGDQFDIRGFHDELLGAGAMPLSLLETRMNAWIENQLAKQSR